MYAIAFDLSYHFIKKHYLTREDFYQEFYKELECFGMRPTQVEQIHFLDNDNPLSSLILVINKISSITGLRECIMNLVAFKVDGWSDITDNIKNFD